MDNKLSNQINNAWSVFEKTGKITAYLNYRSLSASNSNPKTIIPNQSGIGGTNAQGHRRDSVKGNTSGRE